MEIMDYTTIPQERMVLEGELGYMSLADIEIGFRAADALREEEVFPRSTIWLRAWRATLLRQ